MSLANTKRFIAFALAIVFCVGAMSFSIGESTAVSAKSGSYNEPTVRVGMYVSAPMLNTTRFSALTSSGSGFEIGYSVSDSFKKVFALSNTQIMILPQVNANFSDGSCVAGEGNVGAYSAVIGKYSSYSEAASAASAVGGFVAVVNGGFEARNHSAASAEGVKALGGEKVASPASGGITVLDGSTGKVLFTYEDSSRVFAIRAQGGGSVVIPMKHYSGSTNKYSYLGFFEYTVSGGKLNMINVLGLELYTKCVMANEIGTNYSVETRKAFSVLARTVPINSKHSAGGYDVCNNPACCQVYHGIFRMSDENNAIVDSTRGLICTYNGRPISVLYHNSNGGASCSSAAAWGGAQAVPYLTTVFQEEYQDGDQWQYEYTKSEFYDYLRSRGSFSSLSDEDISMKIVETDPYGSDYITVLSVSDGSGNTVSVETSEVIRRACGFDSANFELEYSEEVTVLTADGTVETQTVTGVMTSDGYKPFEGFGESYETLSGNTLSPQKVTINGEGRGHGVGFSATGSEQLSQDGYSYEYILNVFFNGTKLQYAK